MRAELHAVHDRALADARDGVEVESRFEAGRAGEILTEESGALDLLVVGSRGYGPLNTVLLGSTTTVLARAAMCPLLVLPRGTQLDLPGAPSRRGDASSTSSEHALASGRGRPSADPVVRLGRALVATRPREALACRLACAGHDRGRLKERSVGRGHVSAVALRGGGPVEPAG